MDVPGLPTEEIPELTVDQDQAEPTRKPSMIPSMSVGVGAVVASLLVLGTLTLYQAGRLAFTCWMPTYELEHLPSVADACTDAWRPYVLAPVWALVLCLLAALSMIIGSRRPRLSWPIAGALIVGAGVVFAIVQYA